MIPDANDLCVFAVKRGNIEKRIDITYYHPESTKIIMSIQNSRHSVLPLEKLLSNLTDGTHYTPTYTNTGVRFISVTNVKEDEIDFTNTKFISEEEHAKYIKRCYPKPGDILLTKIGSIGRAAVIPNNCPNFSIFVSVALIQPLSTIVPDYLCAYLNSTLAKKQFDRHLKGIGVPDLHLENIAQTLVIVPPYSQQALFAQNYTNSIKNKKEKEREADELLKNFENGLSDKYSLQLESKEKVCFAVRYKDIDGVINAKRYLATKYHQSHALKISDICDIVESKVNISQYEEQLIDWVRIDDLPNNPIDIEIMRTVAASEMEGSFFEVKKHDILVARLGPTILNQKIVLVRSIERPTLASAEFLVLRCKAGYNPEAVMAILKTEYYRDLMYSHSRGSTPSRYRLNREDALKLPFPDIKESQDQIAQEALRVRDEVLKLRKEAIDEWITAKANFEKELLGE